jgi:hypothetical protein
MSADHILLAIQDLNKLKTELKEIKRDMKDFEKIPREDYNNLKKAYKDLRGQLKSIEEEWRKQLLQDNEYNGLREMKMKKEEDIASAMKKLFDALEKLPKTPVTMKVDTEDGSINVQIQPEMRIYLNGREERKRV